MPPAMGQPINVVEKPSSTRGIARFEINRSLTGMGHERYLSVDDVLDDRPVDELARRLFETGGVTQVHANGSVVIVHLAEGWTGGRLLDVIRGLYVYYPPAAPTGTGTAPEVESDREAPEATTAPEATKAPEAEEAGDAAEEAGEGQDRPDAAAEPHQADEATAEQEPAPQPEAVPEPESSISAGVEPAAEPDLEPAPDQDPEAVADAEVEAAALEANGPEADQPEPEPNAGTERAPAGTKSPK
jgi:hypothetical protein